MWVVVGERAENNASARCPIVDDDNDDDNDADDSPLIVPSICLVLREDHIFFLIKGIIIQICFGLR